MTLRIEAYTYDGWDYSTLMEQHIPAVDNWERVLRKMYDWVWKHCDQDNVVDLFAVMINEEGTHELAQAWAVEYMEKYPKCELPFM